MEKGRRTGEEMESGRRRGGDVAEKSWRGGGDDEWAKWVKNSEVTHR